MPVLDGEATPEILPMMPGDFAKRAEGYPKRFKIYADCIPWSIPFGSYYNHRPVYTAPEVLAGPSYAHPDIVDEHVKGMIRSYFPLLWDRNGLPLNPAGRTGLGGRGLLGKWGTNNAGDPILTCCAPDGTLYLLAIVRGDCKKLAIPGGMCDAGETISQTLQRELSEETAVKAIDMNSGEIVFCGYVNDPRNTDQAWVETIAVHRHIDYDLAMSLPISAGDDAESVFWLQLTPDVINGGMYASHSSLVKKALAKLAIRDKNLAHTVAALHC